MTTTLKRLAATRIMTYTSNRPRIVQSPNNCFLTLDDFTNRRQRKHALINPRKVNNVGFLKLWKLRNIVAYVGNINIKKVFAGEVKTTENAPSFPKKTKSLPHASAQTNHRYAV